MASNLQTTQFLVNMTKRIIKQTQIWLEQQDYNPGFADGIMGPRTKNALNSVPDLPLDWPDRKKLVGFIQLTAQKNGIDAGPVDGLWGPRTQFAFDEMVRRASRLGRSRELRRPEELIPLNPNSWPSQQTDQQLIEYYGEPGENQVRIQLPYPHKLAWDTSTIVKSFMCHSKVHDSLSRVLTKVTEVYSMDDIQNLRLNLWGGCLNVRKMRGGSRYSMHSWGIAVDYDPVRNPLHWGFDRASFAKRDYDDWWKIWEQEGWVSLGRQRNFDWMHIQAARL